MAELLTPILQYFRVYGLMLEFYWDNGNYEGSYYNGFYRVYVGVILDIKV